MPVETPPYDPFKPYEPYATPKIVGAPADVTPEQEAQYIQSLMAGLGITGPADSRTAQYAALDPRMSDALNAAGAARGGIDVQSNINKVRDVYAPAAAQIESNYANMLQNWNTNILGAASDFGRRREATGRWGADFERGQRQWGAEFGAGQAGKAYDYALGEHEKQYERNLFNPWMYDYSAMLTLGPKDYNKYFGVVDSQQPQQPAGPTVESVQEQPWITPGDEQYY